MDVLSTEGSLAETVKELELLKKSMLISTSLISKRVSFPVETYQFLNTSFWMFYVKKWILKTSEKKRKPSYISIQK
jgi:hypothetical protein